MDIEKFNLILSLTRPYYKLEAFMAGSGPVARIVYDANAPDSETCREELVRNTWYIYFSSGNSIEDAANKVIEKWNSRKSN